MSNSMKRRVTVLASMISVLLVTSIAFAAWTSNADGAGQAESGAAQAVTIETATVTTKLFPTLEGDVGVKVTNPNTYPVKVSSIQHDDVAITSSDTACDVATSVQTNRTGDLLSSAQDDTVIAAGGNATFTLANAVKMLADADNDCQSDTFTVPVSVQAASSN
jgi:hypothetical protein